MVLAGLETLTNGRISLDNTDITELDEGRLAALRRDLVGIVFQAFRLIPSLTALQNVAIPLELAGHKDVNHLAKPRCGQLAWHIVSTSSRPNVWRRATACSHCRAIVAKPISLPMNQLATSTV